MSELKRCPFCGGSASVKCDKYTKRYYVVCDLEYGDCACIPSTWECDTKEEAIETWNTKKPADDVLERLEDMITFAENMPPVRDEYSAISYEKAESFIEAYKEAIEIVKEVMGYD